MLSFDDKIHSKASIKRHAFASLIHVFPVILIWSNVVVPLVIGGLIYLSWRSQHLLMFSWAHTLGISSYVATIREIAEPMIVFVPDWVLFSLPDAAWVYSMTAVYSVLWNDTKDIEGYFWISLGLILGLGGEFGQLIGVVPGTFDCIDVFVMCIATILAFYSMERLLCRDSGP